MLPPLSLGAAAPLAVLSSDVVVVAPPSPPLPGQVVVAYEVLPDSDGGCSCDLNLIGILSMCILILTFLPLAWIPCVIPECRRKYARPVFGFPPPPGAVVVPVGGGGAVGAQAQWQPQQQQVQWQQPPPQPPQPQQQTTPYVPLTTAMVGGGGDVAAGGGGPSAAAAAPAAPTKQV
jgi:hypothetical protein